MHLNVPRELHALISELAGRVGTPPASFIVSMLKESVPTFQAMNTALALAHQGNGIDDALAGLQDHLVAQLKEGADALST
jgi:hypothetical protein